ncbi:MAG: type II toxin-antitoxin system Phd/YefM family antitoxin [Oscillospiraceae bacterium]|nr:type II toxin-antitoxin system Phd/YefM family antitoxin [Oscillospiraceae bacterium]
MTAINYSKIGKNFNEYCDKVINNFEPVIITRGDNEENVVLISEKEYSNLLENLYIRSNEANYKRLLKSIAQLRSGKGTEHELIEVDDEKNME